MEFLGDLIGGLAGGAASPILGAFSTVFGGLFGYLELKSKRKHEIAILKEKRQEAAADRKHDLDMLQQEGVNVEKVQAIKTDGEMTAAAHASDKATYSDDIKLKLGKGWVGSFVSGLCALMMFFVDFYRGVIRPSITLYGWGLTTYIFVEFSPALSSLTPEQKYNIALIIINAVLFMTTRATGYWFGARGTIASLQS